MIGVSIPMFSSYNVKMSAGATARAPTAAGPLRTAAPSPRAMASAAFCPAGLLMSSSGPFAPSACRNVPRASAASSPRSASACAARPRAVSPAANDGSSVSWRRATACG